MAYRKVVPCRKNIDAVKNYTPGKPIEELQRELGLREVYKLASNEIPFSPSYITQAVLRELPSINRYPEASCYCLRRELAKKMRVAASQLVFGNGSDEIIVMALRAFADARSNVIVGFPTFLIYEIQAAISGTRIKRISFKNDRYDLDAMAAAIDKNTRLIFIANPDNPHGTYISHKEVKRFLRNVPAHVVVFFDEAYFEFARNKDFPRILEFLAERGNIIAARTFSKVYGLAGLRIGYAITTDPIAAILNKVREPFNVNRIAQVAAFAALQNKRFLEKTVAYILKEKRYLYNAFTRLGLTYVESATNFVLVRCSGDAAPLAAYLLRKGIIVRDMAGWGLRSCFRVTVGLHKENKALVAYLKEYFSGRREKIVLRAGKRR